VSENAVVLEITDTGIGIPEGLDIFRFSHTTKINGTGMGLRIVKQIVAAHNGAISYESDGRCGTTFRLRFPCRGLSSTSRASKAELLRRVHTAEAPR
jgi:two-component system OmpR family sensor kinase